MKKYEINAFIKGFQKGLVVSVILSIPILIAVYFYNL